MIPKKRKNSNSSLQVKLEKYQIKKLEEKLQQAQLQL